MKKTHKGFKIISEFLKSFSLSKVLRVFTRDLKVICHNIAALIIIAGLCILPSLYAWINIRACWDPYAKTGNLPVAIVNNDEGAVFNGKSINVGENIIEELKQNKSIGWTFIDDWQGNYGLNEGKFYAMIEIPRNFSAGLISLSTLNPTKPAIIYRINGKLNAIAAKITNVAKDKLVDSIKSNFVSTVNKQVITTLKADAGKTHINKAQLLELKNTVNEANTNIMSLKDHIGTANMNSADFQKYLNTVTVLLPKLSEQISSLEKVTQAGKSLTLNTKQTIDGLSSELYSDVSMAQSLSDKNKLLLARLKDINSNTIDDDTVNIMKQTMDICDSMNTILNSDCASLKSINQSYNYNAITFLVKSLEALDRLVMTEKKKLAEMAPLTAGGSAKAPTAAAIEQLSMINDELTGQVQTVSNNLYSTSSPVLDTMVNNLSVKLDDTGSILESMKTVLPQLNALSVFSSASSKLSVDQANKLSSKLSLLQSDLKKMMDKMNTMTNDNIDKIIDIVQNHPSEIAAFTSSPIEVKEVQVYNGGVFGIGLTPFYTVLAIWVGALLLCALLSVECEDFEDGEKLNLRQKHFGKMLLFIFISLIQSTIITVGDVYILHIKPVNMPLMMVFSVVSSITFTVIIFTLTSIFGNVGKAIAVIMMVFQIAGSGGIYPIQTNPKIFGMMQPLWPFTYAINGFREAIAGPIWKSVYANLRALGIFIAAFLLLAILKKPLHKLTGFFEEKYKEAEL